MFQDKEYKGIHSPTNGKAATTSCNIYRFPLALPCSHPLGPAAVLRCGGRHALASCSAAIPNAAAVSWSWWALRFAAAGPPPRSSRFFYWSWWAWWAFAPDSSRLPPIQKQQHTALPSARRPHCAQAVCHSTPTAPARLSHAPMPTAGAFGAALHGTPLGLVRPTCCSVRKGRFISGN